MYKTFASVSLAILVMASSVHAANPPRRILTPKTTIPVMRNQAVRKPTPAPPVQATVKPQTLPILDIGFDRINSVYCEGERVVITITVRKDGVNKKHLYVFNVDSEGETTVLFPNVWHKEHGLGNLVQGGVQFTIPASDNDGFHLEVVGPNFGTEKMIAVLTDEPIDPARVGAKSFTNSCATPIDSFKFKKVIPVMKNAVIVEKTFTTVPQQSTNSPAIGRDSE